MKRVNPNNKDQYVELEGKLLYIHEGDGYYDTRVTFHSDSIINLNEEKGVRGGHVGWQLTYIVKGSKKEHDLGRKLPWAMEIVKDLIIKFPDLFPKASITLEENKAQKCY